MCDVLDYSVFQFRVRASDGGADELRDVRVHGLDEEILIFVVHGHDNEQLGLTTVKILPKRILAAKEVIGI